MKTLLSSFPPATGRARWARPITSLLLMLLASLCSLTSLARAQVSLDAPTLILKTEKLSVRVQPKNAWTLNLISWQDKIIVPEKGFQGLVIDLDSAKFVGTGHTEGGREEVLSVALTADGKAAEYSGGGTIEAKEFVLTKNSKLAGARLESVLRLRADVLECTHHLKIEESFSIGKIYAFMFPWSPLTDDWMAQTTKDEILEGDFTKPAPWELVKDVRWSAIYDPSVQMAMLTQFASNSQAGEGVRHGYWNQKVYHKQYYQPLARRELKAGEEYSYAMTLRPIPATPADWKEKVRATAAQFPLK